MPLTPRVADTMIGARELGTMWRKMMRTSDAPSARAAWTNSDSLNTRNWARMSLPISNQPRPAMTRTNTVRLTPPKAAVTATTTRMNGMAMITSVNRIKALSIQPP